jgi:hypothetical protein
VVDEIVSTFLRPYPIFCEQFIEMLLSEATKECINSVCDRINLKLGDDSDLILTSYRQNCMKCLIQTSRAIIDDRIEGQPLIAVIGDKLQESLFEILQKRYLN